MIKDYIKNNQLKIIVKPNSPKTQITGYTLDSIKINIKAPPEKGKANIEVVKFFSKLLKKKVTIKSGITSRSKILRV